MSMINLKTKRQQLGILQNAERYITTPVRYSNITSEQLINYASEASGISKSMMSASFYAIAQQIEFFVLNGHGLTIGNLGNLYLAIETEATLTEDAAGADAVKRICVKFRQSKKLKDLLNSTITLNTLRTSSTSSGTGTGTESGGSSGGSGGSSSGGDENFDPLGN